MRAADEVGWSGGETSLIGRGKVGSPGHASGDSRCQHSIQDHSPLPSRPTPHLTPLSAVHLLDWMSSSSSHPYTLANSPPIPTYSRSPSQPALNQSTSSLGETNLSQMSISHSQSQQLGKILSRTPSTDDGLYADPEVEELMMVIPDEDIKPRPSQVQADQDMEADQDGEDDQSDREAVEKPILTSESSVYSLRVCRLVLTCWSVGPSRGSPPSHKRAGQSVNSDQPNLPLTRNTLQSGQRTDRIHPDRFRQLATKQPRRLGQDRRLR